MSYHDNGTTKAVYNALYRKSLDYQSIRDILKHDILADTTLNNRKIDEIAIEISGYKSKNFLFNNKDQSDIASVISAYVKGNRYNGKLWEPIFNNFNKFCEGKYIFSDGQWNALFGLIHQVIMSSLTDIQMFSYIEQTFPLWSGLKRILLQKRRGTDLKQWEYALKKCNITDKKLDNIGSDMKSFPAELNAVQSYKYLKDHYAKLLITAICQTEFPDWRIDNTISQPSKHKGWFPNGILRSPMQHDVEKIVLYKIGYSFNLSLRDFEKLTTSCEKAVYDAFSIEDNLYRFGMQYSIKYSEISGIIAKAKTNPKRFRSQPIEYNQVAMKKKINKFFEENDYSDNLVEKYLDFLDTNGVCRKSAELLATMRAKNAHKYLCGLHNKFDLENIKYYYEDFDVSNPNVPDIPDVADLLKEKYDNDCENYYCYFEDYIRKISETKDYRESTKNKVLMLMCDGINVDAKDIASGAFKQARLKNIMECSDDLLRYPIRRSEILRLAYLDTLLSYFNYDIKDDSDIIARFEDIANRMLSECEFLPLHITLKLDFIMYLALSEEKRCKTNVFQVFIPRIKNL